MLTIDDIIKRCEKHNNDIDYSITKYKGITNNIRYICAKHGEIEQRASYHILVGCPRCNYRKLKDRSLGNFIRRARDSRSFDSFKFYIMKLKGEDEDFYKFGITYRDIKERVKNLQRHYDCEVLLICEGSNPRTIMQLELDFRDAVYHIKYTPKKSFSGCNECFL